MPVVCVVDRVQAARLGLAAFARTYPMSGSPEKLSPRPRVLGLLGGIASGKSYVANLLAAQGAVVLDADRAGHEVLNDRNVQWALQNRWGKQVFTAQGDVDRKAVGAIVFADPAELKFLEQLTHPQIGERLRQQLTAIQDTHRGSEDTLAAVLDAPVMLKAGWDALCDEIWFIDAPREVRLQRALDRGWSPEQFQAREAAQEPLEEKRLRADRIIENGWMEHGPIKNSTASNSTASNSPAFKNSPASDSVARTVFACWQAFLQSSSAAS